MSTLLLVLLVLFALGGGGGDILVRVGSARWLFDRGRWLAQRKVAVIVDLMRVKIWIPSVAGLILRYDHGTQYRSEDFQNEVRFRGMDSSPSFRQPEGNGCIERFFRTLKNQLLGVRHCETVDELQQALLEFQESYNRQGLIARLGYKTPWQVRQDLLAGKNAA
jgi:transposase InsO family protein